MVSNETRSSYRQIMKATSIFGGVQAINIIISIVRSKFIAVLLGPAGIGISGLLTATTGIITGLTNFGLGTSAVRDISSAHQTGNTTRFAIIVKVFQRWVWITGLLGLVITLLCAPLLSYLSFGNWDYTLAFMALSVTLLFNQLNSGQLVVLQGSRKLSFLAKANVMGSIIGLCTTIPLYYLWGNKGIVPALLISSMVALIISTFFSRKIVIEKIKVSKVRVYAEGKFMIKMGIMISLSGFITLGFSYLVRLYLSHCGGIDSVGYYNAGFAIINTYVGIIFAAMSTDYFPRLSSVVDNKTEVNTTINQQAEIAFLILGPVIIGFIVFIKWIVTLLYSKEFIVIDHMMIWAAYGMLFKAASWAIAFLFLAKGASTVFFWNELIANVYMLALNIAGYYLGGLTGLGISFMVSYLLYFLQVFLLTRYYYGFKFEAQFYKIALIQFVLTSCCMLLVFLQVTTVMGYILGCGILCGSAVYSYYEMNKRINIKELVQKVLKR